MPAAAPWIAAAVAAAAAGGGAIQANQQAQHAKGAAEAQKTEMDAQIKGAQDLDAAKLRQSAEDASASAAGNANALAGKLLARKRTLIGGSSTADSSILSSGSDNAPIATKTLLGA